MIYNKDCLLAMKDIPDYSIDAIITDPPYGTTACKWDSIIPFDLMWEQLNRIIKSNGAIVLFGSEPFSSALRMSNIKNYKYDWIWKKNKPIGALNANRMPMQNHEVISVFYKKQPTYNKILEPRECNEASKKRYEYKMTGFVGSNTMGITKTQKKKYDPKMRNPTTVKEFDLTPNPKRLHPTQKPVALMEYLIKTYTNENETVLDFTMGSGTTGVACLNTNRKFIGIENNKEYFEVALKRIQEHKAQMRLF